MARNAVQPSDSIPNFLGGINEELDYSLIKPNEASKAQNCFINEGVLTVGNGFVPYSTPTLASSIGTLMAYYKDGSTYLLAACGDKIYKYSGGTWNQITSGMLSDKWDYVNDNYNNSDVIIMANGVDKVKIYDGTTFRNLKHDGKDSTAGSSNTVSGKYIDLHYERLWVADDYNLYFSTADRDGFDIEDFTAPTAPLEVNQHGGQIFLYTNDGSKIIGIKVIYDDIIVFKEKSIFKIFGSSPDNYQKVQLFTSNGAIADKTIVGTSKGAYYVNRDGIYVYDGTNVTLISQRLKNTFLNISLNYIQNSVGVFYNNKYIIAVPEGTSTVNNLIIEYDVNAKNFMVRRGYQVSSWLEYNNQLLFVGVDNKIYVYDSGTTLNGQPITMYWESGYNDKGMPDVTKEIESLYLTAKGTGSVKVTVTTEYGDKYVTVNLTGNEAVFPINYTHRGRLLKYRIENVSGSIFTVKSFKVIMSLDRD